MNSVVSPNTLQTPNPGDLVTATSAIKPPGFQKQFKNIVSLEKAILTN
ncbi:MAG: hypothetical protein F6K22_35950 [Okeania sp. SIO2F4]|nr:hypothetical protein [Okeania sp. SIO2F4]NES07712.1 hypothetical protein [Okeania sp. SIO2F4]